MTLIITYISKDLIIQAADRQITEYTDTSTRGNKPKYKIKIIESEQVKSVIHAQSVMAFTGLAELPISSNMIKNGTASLVGKIPTVQWLLEVIRQNDVAQPYAAIAKEATNVFKALHNIPRAWRNQFFIGAAWLSEEGQDVLVPRIISVDNREDGLNFKINQIALPVELPYAVVYSKPVNKLVEKVARRQLQKIAKMNGGANAIARALVEIIRAAAVYSEDIGKSVNVVCIPRVVVENFDKGTPIDLTHEPIDNMHLRFRYFPGLDSSATGLPTSPGFVQSKDVVARSITLGMGGKLLIANSNAELSN